jgi:hypothetical protein
MQTTEKMLSHAWWVMMMAMMTMRGGNFGMSGLAKALTVVSTVGLYIKLYVAIYSCGMINKIVTHGNWVHATF